MSNINENKSAYVYNFKKQIDPNKFTDTKNEKTANFFAKQNSLFSTYNENEENLIGIDFDFDGQIDANIAFKKNNDELVANLYSPKTNEQMQTVYIKNDDNNTSISIDYNIDGKIDYVTSYNENKKQQEQSIEYFDNAIVTKSTIFDENEQATSYEITNEWLDPNKNIEKRTTNTYNQNGEISLFVQEDNFHKNNIPSRIYAHEYASTANGETDTNKITRFDTSGKILSQTFTQTSDDSKYEYDLYVKYNQDGNVAGSFMTEDNEYESKKEHKEELEIFNYDEQGNFVNRVITTETYNENEKLIQREIKAYADATANKNSLAIYTETYDDSGELIAQNQIAYDPAGVSIDEKINYTSQGNVNDCWLLSTLNGLKDYSPKIINNLISHKENISTIHLAVGKYDITDEELSQKKLENQYNFNDDDIVLIEIAIEKALNDYKNDKFTLDIPQDADKYGHISHKHEENENGGLLIDAGFTEQAYYFLTGNTPDSVHRPKEGNTEEYIAGIKDSINNKEKFAVTVIDFKILNNMDTDEESSPHACTITAINNGYITLRDPYNATETFNVPLDKFLESCIRIATYNA